MLTCSLSHFLQNCLVDQSPIMPSLYVLYTNLTPFKLICNFQSTFVYEYIFIKFSMLSRQQSPTQIVSSVSACVTFIRVWIGSSYALCVQNILLTFSVYKGSVRVRWTVSYSEFCECCTCQQLNKYSPESKIEPLNPCIRSCK